MASLLLKRCLRLNFILSGDAIGELTDKVCVKRLFVSFLLLSQAFAADAVAPVGDQRMFVLKYTDAAKLRKLFSRYSYPMSSNRDYNVLTVTGPAGFQAQVEAAIKLFDVAPDPPKNIELAIYLITTKETPGSLPLPKELDGKYRGYRLADSQVIRIRTGQPAESSGLALLAQVRFRGASIGPGEKDRVISIDGLRVQLKAPDTASLSTDIDLRENQPAVIGKTNPDGLLVAVARVAE